MLVGVSHRLTWSTKVYVDREEETSSALKRWNVDGGGDSLNMRLPSKNRRKKFQTGLYDIECCWRYSQCSSLEVSEPTDF